MGNDGGSIPTRRELVKSPTRKPTHSQVRDTTAQTQAYRWTTCPLSKRPLTEPIVSDSAGILYNKESILEWLVQGTDAFGDGEEVLDGRVRSLRDVVEVKFESVDDEGGKKSPDANRWVCPVSRKELGPGTKAVYIVPCGHAFAETAVREVGDSHTGCLTCNEPYEETNVIVINPIESKDIDALKERVAKLAENGVTHSLKKSPEKKSKKRKGDSEVSDKKKKKKEKESNLKNAATSALTAKVLNDEKLNAEQRKLGMNDNLKSLFSSESSAIGKNNDFMTRGYTVPTKK